MSMYAKQTIEKYITEALYDKASYFVFPSAILAQFWAGSAAESTLYPVDSSRFIAWDTFKSETLSTRKNDEVSANDASRVLFLAALLEENAGRDIPFFTELITPEHATSFSSFIPSLTRILPSLDKLAQRIREKPEQLDDSYFKDLYYLYDRYNLFLDQYKIFEPGWKRSPFRNTGLRWMLFYPELAEDWLDYVDELGREPNVCIIPLSSIVRPSCKQLKELKLVLGAQEDRLIRFSTARKELRHLVLSIRNILDTDLLDPEDIVISVPDLEQYEERLSLEFKLLDLPLSIRRGRPLAQYPGGRIFAALGACKTERWSYQALQELLLDQAYPWKEKQLIDALMEFGLRYRCLSGFPEDGREVDVWEESFQHLGMDNSQNSFAIPRIQRFYRRLKQDILAVLQAKSFSELREKLLIFISNHLDRSAIAVDVDKVFSRSMDVLASLSETEERLTGLRIPSPYTLFLSRLREEPYSFNDTHGGIRVYAYRVAAGIGPAVHFLIHMTQDAATVRSGANSFLREDKKTSLGLIDRDFSEDFIRSYLVSGSLVLFSAPDKDFSSHGVPHFLLSKLLPRDDLAASELPALPDPLVVEELLQDPPGTLPGSLQVQGYSAARCIRDGSRAPDLRMHPPQDELLKGILRSRLVERDGDRKLSPTDLNEFLSCPFSWLLRRGLRIHEKQTGIETIDQRELGILYHRILEGLFSRIRAEDRNFRSDMLEIYFEYLREEITSALAEGREKEGAFQESVYGMLVNRLYASLQSYMETDAPVLEGCEILGAEYPLRRDYPQLGIALSGKADLVLKQDTGGLILTDFKTGLMPSSGELCAGEGGEVENVQIASYIRMLEREDSEQVEIARFYSLDRREYRKVIDPQGPARSNALLPVPRDEYQMAVLQVDEVLSQCCTCLSQGAYYIPPPEARDVCSSCRVSSVCRIVFSGGET